MDPPIKATKSIYVVVALMARVKHVKALMCVDHSFSKPEQVYSLSFKRKESQKFRVHV